jgi:hypothetical protein
LVQFAWNFWTNVRNWKLDADVDSIELQREFARPLFGVNRQVCLKKEENVKKKDKKA